MSKVTKKSRDFTKEEKLAILKEGAENGIKPTLAKHNLLPATYYYWKRTLQEEPLSVVKAERKLLEKQLKKLQTENRVLKLMLAEEQLKSRLKSELLKKNVLPRRADRTVPELYGSWLKTTRCAIHYGCK